MKEILDKLTEFGNFLLSINNDDDKKCFINGVFFNKSVFYRLQFIKFLRKQNDDEDDNSDPDNIKKSQLTFLIDDFGLDNTDDNLLKLKEYLEYFESIKDQIDLNSIPSFL